MPKKRQRKIKNYKDHFSDHSEDYRQYRPGYPAELFEYLASVSQQHELAWDCATGNGQAATMLAPFFNKVIASDASEQQIKNNLVVENIEYMMMPAERTGLISQSIDLITVAQALHWFDVGAFFTEVKRLLKPDGVLAVWCYNFLKIEDTIDNIVNHLYSVILHDYWPPERAVVEKNYNDIKFPFEIETSTAFNMQTQWSLNQLLGYLGTWSATQAYIKDKGLDPVTSIAGELNQAWGSVDSIKTVSWPLTLIIGRN